MLGSKVILYEEEKNCCACGACENVCPTKAIKMKKNTYGYMYPEVDEILCVQCKRCKEVCSFQKNNLFETTKEVYAACALDYDKLYESSSGGVFTVLANHIINDNGCVYGCALEFENKSLVPKHIRIDNVNDLMKVKGSKYVQSKIGNVYKLVKEDLENERRVLFSGTPCQVDGLKGFLGMKNYPNLLTVDIICHGVPSEQIFHDYVKLLEDKQNSNIIDFKFRDKKYGWGLQGTITYKAKNKIRNKILSTRVSSYYQLFMNGEIYRESCYNCKYACSARVSDVTLGDYWGIQQVHPEYLYQNGGPYIGEKGISCIILNSAKGKAMIDDCKSQLLLKRSSFQNVASNNGQLNRPSSEGKNRSHILSLYKNGGYKEVEKWFNKHLGKKRYMYLIWDGLPNSVKMFIWKIRHI
jgi:coenzyme F420-reducing hydrogenase beta subunit